MSTMKGKVSMNGRQAALMVFTISFLFASLTLSTCNAAIILFEDTFDSENSGTFSLNYFGFTKWDVVRGTVDLAGNGRFDYFPGNGLYVDLDGTTNQGGKLQTKSEITIAPGLYEFQFKIANVAERMPTVTNTMEVSLPGLFTESFSRTGFPPQFETIVRTIQVQTQIQTRIIFDQFGNDNEGIMIDNVRLSSVPEPTSVPLLAIAAILFVRRRIRYI